MQIYAIKMHNFLRFGEKNNSIVFDLDENQKAQIISGEKTMDDMYENFSKSPIEHINKIRSNGIQGLLGIVGKIDGNTDSSNGAGKSSIMEAICYAHYGKIVRLSANNESTGDAGNAIITQINGNIPENVSQSWVEEYFETNGKIYRVKRGRALSKNRKTTSPILEFENINENNIVSESGHRTTDTNKNIEEINDMPYDLFVNSQMFGQNDAGKFLFGTDKIRKEMLISLLNMENEVYACLKFVREKKSNSDKKINSTRDTIKIFEDQLINIHKNHISDNQNTFSESMQKNVVLFLNQLIEDTQIDIKNYEESLIILKNKITQLSNSELIKKIDKALEEGKKIKLEKDAKIKQREEQKSQWLKLVSDLSNDEIKKNQEKNSYADKIKNTKEQIEKIKDFIEHFNKNEYEEKISKAQKSKDAKPKYEAKKQELSEIAIEHTELLSELKTKLDIADKLILKFQNQISKFKNSSEIECIECGSLVEIDHFQNKILEENSKKQNLQKEIIDLRSKKEKNDNLINEVNARLKKISEFIQSEAEAIVSISSFKSKEQTIFSLNERLTDLQKSLQNIEADILQIITTKNNHLQRIEQIDLNFKSEIEDMDNKLTDLKNQISEAKADSEEIQKKINILNLEVKDIENKKTKANESIGFIRKEIEQFKTISQEINNKTKILNEEIKHLTRLEKLEDVFGLDGIQTRIVKRYLPLLNVYIKEFLDILSENMLNVSMVINDKSEIDIAINGGTASSYKMLSGGEKMIIRLAVDIGLALLKFVRSKKNPDIICLDEIFGPLDASKTSAVFKMLNCLQDKFNRVLIITHNSDIKDLIPNNILVEKSGGIYGTSEIKYIT